MASRRLWLNVLVIAASVLLSVEATTAAPSTRGERSLSEGGTRSVPRHALTGALNRRVTRYHSAKRWVLPRPQIRLSARPGQPFDVSDDPDAVEEEVGFDAEVARSDHFSALYPAATPVGCRHPTGTRVGDCHCETARLSTLLAHIYGKRGPPNRLLFLRGRG